MRRNATKRVAAPRRKPDGPYTLSALRLAIIRAVERANREPARRPLPDGVAGPVQPPVPTWHPNQLRHLYATHVRHRHGMQAAQVLLGHAHANTSEIYAEKNLGLAIQVAAEVG